MRVTLAVLLRILSGKQFQENVAATANAHGLLGVSVFWESRSYLRRRRLCFWFRLFVCLSVG